MFQEKSSKVVERSGYRNLSKYQIWKGIERILQFVWFCSRRRGLQADTDEMVNVPSIV
jgi:hypothetical protein